MLAHNRWTTSFWRCPSTHLKAPYFILYLCATCMQYRQRPEGGDRVLETVIAGHCKVSPAPKLGSQDLSCKLDLQTHRPFESKAFLIREEGLSSQNTGLSQVKPTSPSAPMFYDETVGKWKLGIPQKDLGLGFFNLAVIGPSSHAWELQ